MIKKIIYLIIFTIIFANLSYAETQNAQVEYDGQQYYFKAGDETLFLENGNKFINLYEHAKSETDKKFYLQEAMRYYFLLSKINPESLDAHLGLARVYDHMKIDNFSKAQFFDALNFDINNGATNYYFASFHYDRQDLITALFYYKIAMANGYSDDYDANLKVALIYEQLADIQSAIKYYTKAQKLNRKDSSQLGAKIHLLDDLNYTESQYYLFGKSGEKDKYK